MRLIDADVVRATIDEALEDRSKNAGLVKKVRMIILSEFAKEVIAAADTVDAVPVVRCKDCKHRVKYSCDTIEFFECDHIGIGTTRVGVKDDFYCADGERRC